MNAGHGGGSVLVADEAVFAIVPPFRFESRGVGAALEEHAGNFIAACAVAGRGAWAGALGSPPPQGGGRPMKRIIISHEARQLFQSGAFRALLLLTAGAIAFAAWSGQRSIDRQIEGASAAQAFEDGRRAKMRADTEQYQARVAAEGGNYEFASAQHAPGAVSRRKAPTQALWGPLRANYLMAAAHRTGSLFDRPERHPAQLTFRCR